MIENIENLRIVPSYTYCEDNQYICVRQISSWESMRGNISGYLYQYDDYSNSVFEYDVCLVTRVEEYGRTCLKHTVIPYDELPQRVIDYLDKNNYKHK